MNLTKAKLQHDRHAKDPIVTLTAHEKECADYITKNIAAYPGHERGLYIYTTCHDMFHITDHKKIAKHLGQRQRFRG